MNTTQYNTILLPAEVYQWYNDNAKEETQKTHKKKTPKKTKKKRKQKKQNKTKQNKTKQNKTKKNNTKLNDTVHSGGEGRMTVEPKARIPPPQGDGESSEKLAGGAGGVLIADPLGNRLPDGADNLNCVLAQTSQSISHDGQEVHSR